ncbi:hypothetical protein V496_01833 [Pseudogymnoascus sp. VKM F-4515 (FW-2607)]|nr:hypothetical protein V496_01833 [Pseudogymnoascus sp. VKM F-4515 (FW-2607)]
MSTTTHLAQSDVDSFDYIIVGGGTAGCVIASRLAEYLPHKKTLLIEAGPSDYMDDRVLLLKDWLKLLGGELDYDYPTTEQPMGNSHIRHSRAKVLGGCSSHNTLISFRPFEYDAKIWESRGAKAGAQPPSEPAVQGLGELVLQRDGYSRRSRFQQEDYGFDASVAYIHPILSGKEKRPNLTILTNAWVGKVNVTGDRVTGVNVALQSGERLVLKAKKETILCGGAVDTARLLLLSGIGPAEDLSKLNIPVVKDIPGVGENLQDHHESIIIWELNRPVPQNQTTMDSDAGIFLRREKPNSATEGGIPDGNIADTMMHCYQIPFCLNTARLGYDSPDAAFCMTPNTMRPRSRGKLYLTSADPNVKPALDFRYFTDPEGYDAATIVFGLKAARKIAQQEPFKSWIKREVAPGPDVQSDEALSEYGRRVAHTVYHPVGTTKMGDVKTDDKAVVDEKLRVRGLKGVRIADAGVFPTMVSINPMLTVLAIGERCAEMIAEEGGWKMGVEVARL